MTQTEIPLSAPDITALEIDAVVSVLKTPHLSLGPLLPRFEARLATLAGRRHGIAVNSGTSGLHLAVKASGLRAGDRVLTTPFSFIASANCLLMEGCTPVFVDIESHDFNLDPELVTARIEADASSGVPIKGILGVDVFGKPARWDVFESLARTHGLVLIEDCCEAIGASYMDRPAGNFGQAGVFAFYPNKQITTGEGGVIVTDDDRFASLCRSYRNQGRDDGMGWLAHARLGYNYRLSDINCALGLAQLERLEAILAKRNAVAEHYARLLSSLSGVLAPRPMRSGSLSWFVYAIQLSEDHDEESRDRVIRGLRERGIGCNSYFPPIHLQPFYSEAFGFRKGQFPVCESVSSRTIALPFHSNLTEREVETVVNILQRLV